MEDGSLTRVGVVVGCADISGVNANDEEEGGVATIDTLVLPILNERTLAIPQHHSRTSHCQRCTGHDTGSLHA